MNVSYPDRIKTLGFAIMALPLCSLMLHTDVATALSFNGPVLCSSAASDSDGDGWGWENDQSCLVPANHQCEDRGDFPWGWNPVTQSSCRLDNAFQRECEDSPPLNDGWGWNGLTSCRIPITGDGSCEDRGGYPWGWNPATKSSCRLDENGNQQLITQIEDQRAIWDTYNNGNYRFRYSNVSYGFTGIGGCPIIDLLPPFIITVENDQVIRVVDIYSDPPVPRNTDNFATIDQIFDRMLNNVEDIVQTPTFSTLAGYPVSYRVDSNIEGCPNSGTEYSLIVFCDDPVGTAAANCTDL